jgi:uncharacterized RDD family membrane protein YckC
MSSHLPPHSPLLASRPLLHSQNRAGFGPRLGGLLIDLVIVLVPSEAVFLIAGSASIMAWPVIFITYSVVFIASPSGQTPGMRLVGVRAIDATTGGRVHFGASALRCLVSIASWMVCYLGYLWMLWDPERQTWHDKAAGTLVVSTSFYPVDRWPGW